MDIGDKDCALIIRENMDIELIIPKPTGDDNEDSPANAIVMAAISVALHDQTIMEMLYERMDSLIKEGPDDKVSRPH